jgi:hypothetical protein
VVSKSREIYENLMQEDNAMGEEPPGSDGNPPMEEGDDMMGGSQSGDMIDDVETEESGMHEGDDDADAEFDDKAEDDGEDLTHDMEQDHDEEGAMMEAITLKKVSVTHGDNGQNTKSTSLQNSGQAGMDSRPVKFSGASETVPTSPKGPSNFYSKGETQVKDANKWKNAPAQNNADLEAAPKPKAGDNGSNSKSVIESRKPVKRKL